MINNPFQYSKPRKIEGINIGQKIKTVEQVNLPENKSLTVSVDYVVTNVFPYVVETRRHLAGRLETRCFSIGDLVTLGLMSGGGKN